MVRTLSLPASSQGLHLITSQIAGVVADAARIGSLAADGSGLCTVFVRHTSASLLVQENADPSARHDLETWLNRLVPEHDPLYTHNDEGPDDMPAHIKASLTAVSLSIPILHNQLALGTWQGVYLWEHRKGRMPRVIVVHVGP
ncbi:MAG: YjbQ family protein [Pyrinomonadaceae bacterium]|nr:YjbQ family protein [Phycisphaerales bacterium]